MKLIRDFLESFVIVVLVIAGIGGLLYHTFRQAGWGAAALDKAFELYLLHPGAMIPATIVAVIIGAIWYDHRVAHGRYNKKYPTYVLYALMAAGVYFIGRYALRGSL
ncbi:MAG: hypothetical protein HY322_14460 [Betaproteobacteria bacterium]|nr:hypothetical protein [Betaproteobacteria bacterium]